MTYEDAMKEVRNGKAVRHTKMGRGLVVKMTDGVFRIWAGSRLTPYRLNSEDRADKTWEIVE